MKMHRLTGAAVWTLVAMACALGNGSSVAEPSVSEAGERSASLHNVEHTLKTAGASRAELVIFEGWVKGMSQAELAESAKYNDRNPSNVVRRLRSEVRDEQAPAPAAIFPGAVPVMSCSELLKMSLVDTRIDSWSISASDGSCRITATVVHSPADNRIKIFVALPVKSWNGRFMGTGGGGYAGGSVKNLDAPARKGYAVGATDTGNPDGTANFALDSNGKLAWQRLRDNAYIGIHDMSIVGKALTEAFYGRAPRYSYFVGGSTGGRQALTEAQRYPQDYDGILALYPAIARDRYVPAQLWPQVLMNEAHDLLPKAKLDAATAGAVKACDGADGVVDGVIGDPTLCQYNPDALIGSEVGGSIFTAADARIIREIWEGPRTHDGGFLWWGPSRGTDLSNFAGTGGTPLEGKPCEEGLDWFRYFLVLNPQWDWRTLTRGEFELLFDQSIQVHASTYGGDDPDLTGFRDRGGKLLIVHGWADQFVPAQKTVAYTEAVEQRMGGAERTAAFMRLFLVPGGDHGFSVSVPTPRFPQMLSALMQWVENGQAPGMLLAELDGNDGKPVRTRPLFPYPQVAIYKGSGSTDVAANFASSLP
jgi:feruloyl esterase